MSQEVEEAFDPDLYAMLWDRTPLSRFFVKRQFDPNISIEDAISYIGLNGRLKLPIIPNTIFSFNIPKKELLRRCEERDDSEKKDIRRGNLECYTDMYYGIVEEAKSSPIFPNIEELGMSYASQHYKGKVRNYLQL